MNWEQAIGKNGEATLSVDGIQLYSRYRPREDAYAWVDTHFDDSKTNYLLIGLGLGYHAERLLQLANGKSVYVYYFDEYEKHLCMLKEAVNTIDHIDFTHCQVLIPNVWLKVMKDHPILPYLEDIKIHQVTYQKSARLMQQNAEANIQNYIPKPYPMYEKKIACLVASGPSLTATISVLREIQSYVDIFVVGSALKMIVDEGIIPTAVCVTDCKQSIYKQIIDVGYKGDLLFLSTANAEAVWAFDGNKYMLCQHGYEMAETYAKTVDYPLLHTGGSVSTVLFSYIENRQYEYLFLFGQDFAFSNDYTHAVASTSGRTVVKDLNIKTVLANDGTTVYTTPNLQTYARWFERRLALASMKVYTTSQKGYKMERLPYLNSQELQQIIENITSET